MGQVEGLVSIIVPVFNRGPMLREAVESAIAQTHRPIEIIVVDDGSTDDTAAVCGELSERFRSLVRVVKTPNRGPGLAREAGRQEAAGEFIQYLDSDDLLEPGKLAVQVALLRQREDCEIAYGQTALELDGRDTGVHPGSARPVSSIFPSFLAGRLWSTQTPLWRRSLVDRMGPWLGLRLEEDLEYDARAGAAGARLCWTPELVSRTRHHSGARASSDARGTNERLRWRCESHVRVLEHANRAGVTPGCPEMQRYSRELFHLSRQCGAAGMTREGRQLFGLARQAAGTRGNGLDFRVFGVVAGTVGWKAAGRLAGWLDEQRGEPG